MPQAVLSVRGISTRIGQPVGREQAEAALFRSKAEVVRWEGDELVVEVTPDRIDLLTEGGLALYLEGALGFSKGLFAVEGWTPQGTPPLVEVDSSTSPIRPSIGAVLIRAPEGAALEADLLSEAIRFQELLHSTRGADRRVASLGIYPWERLKAPVRYSVEASASLRFIPLGDERETSGSEFLTYHPMAQRYGAYGVVGTGCLTLRDAEGTLLSLPPILNTRSGGEARPGDRVLLLEATGIRESAVQDMLGLLLMVFATRGWQASPVPVRSPRGDDPGTSIIGSHPLSLSTAHLEAVSGLPWTSEAVEHNIAQVRLGGQPVDDGWRVDAPPWRPDLQTEVDVIEDLILARGVQASEGLVAPSAVRGRRLVESRFRARVETLLLGLGYVELHSTILTSRAGAEQLGRPDAVSLANPPSQLYAVFRDTLLLSLVQTLERNVRFGYPQKFFEVGPVVVRDAQGETGTRTRQRAAVLVAGERAGFADAAAVTDYLLASLGAAGVREPAEIPGMIPGRSALVRLAGERVGELGELHPRLLAQVRVPVPAAWAEWDLTALWPLMRRGEGD